jgi:type IV pilus assembly protein PilV
MSRFRIPPSNEQGFSLIEVLVAIVVLSIGLLGLAALQLSGLRVGQSSFYRAQAAQFATDMADRMRANLAEARQYGLALADATPTGTSVRDRDRAEWRARLRTLPGGNGAIAIQQNVNNVDVVTITVRWDDSRGGGAAASDFVLVTNLRAPS